MTPVRRPLPAALATSTGYLLRLAHLRADECADSVLPAGRQARDISFFTIIERMPGRSQQDLADRLGVNRTMMVKLVDRLEADGLVVRRRNPDDRRSYLLEVTPLAQRERTELMPQLARAERALLAPLAGHDRVRLVDLVLTILRGHGRVPGVPDEVARRPGFAFSKAHLLAHDLSGDALAPLGLNVRHVGWLIMLNELAPCSQQDVANALQVSGTTIVEMTDDLERRGMVARSVNPADRRRHVLNLTETGRQALSQVNELARRATADLVAPIGAAAAELNVMLRSVAAVAEPVPNERVPNERVVDKRVASQHPS